MHGNIKYQIIALGAVALLSGVAASAQSVYPGQHKGKMRVETVVPAAAESFDLKDVRLLPGRVRENLERDSVWMSHISVGRMLHSFRTNAGVFAGLEGGYESVKKYGGWESLDCDLRGHTTGHLLSAYGLMHAATGSEIFKLKGDSLVDGLAEVQQTLGNGYLSAFPENLIDRNLQGKSVWAPWYVLHKIMSGLIDQYLYADNTRALDVAVAMGDWAWAKLSGCDGQTRRTMLRNEFGGMNEAFYNLYALTADERYRRLAEHFYHNDVIDPLKEGNFDFGTKHTNTFIPKIIGEMRNYELTGNAGSLALSRGFWDEVAARHTFASGSCSQKEHFFNPGQFSKFLNGYTGETCCTYNMLKLSRHLFCNSADARIADYYERGLFNHILAQQDPQSGMVCYFLPMLSGAFKVYSTPEQSFWCCVGSGFESHAKYAEAIYYHNDSELFVNLFIPSELSWKEKGLKIRQTTQFPEEETTRFEMLEAPAGKLTLKLRYPHWSGAPVVKVNGRRVGVKGGKDGYVALARKWEKGDVVEVTYPMCLRVETTPDNPSRGAVMYGPVLLAGDLGTDGMDAPAPFSDPTVRNDYYTYDYKIPAGLKTSLALDGRKIDDVVRRKGDGLLFVTDEGDRLRPLYDTNHCRYVVYWNLD